MYVVINIEINTCHIHYLALTVSYTNFKRHNLIINYSCLDITLYRIVESTEPDMLIIQVYCDSAYI